MELAAPPEPKTRSNYAANFSNHIAPAWGDRSLTSIQPRDAAELLAAVRTKPRRTRGDGTATVRQVHALIRTLFNAAVSLEVLPPGYPNPASAPGLKPPRPEPREVDPLTPDVVEEIADAARPMYRAMILVMAYCGLRIGEAAALRWRDIDLEAGWLHVRRAVKEDGGRRYVGTPKRDDIRSVALPRRVADAFVAHRSRVRGLGPDDAVFTSPSGKELWPSTFRGREWATACSRAGVQPIPTPHVLRYTAASLMAKAGMAESYIQEALGHGSVEMTQRYIRLYQGERIENRDRLDALLDNPSDANVVLLRGPERTTG